MHIALRHQYYFNGSSGGVVPLTVVSVEAQNDIPVVYGTAFGSISFPAQVDVTLDDASVISVDVIWDEGDYDGDIDGTYTLFGTLVNLPDGTTNPEGITAAVNVIVAPYDDSGETPTPSLWQAIGAGQGIDIGNITVPWPAHAINDVGHLCLVTTPADAAPATPSGWTLINHSSNNSGATQTRLSVFFRRALSTSEASVVVPSPGNHIYGVIFTTRGSYRNLSPVDVSAISNKNTSTATSIAGVNANQDGNDVIYLAARGDDFAGARWSGEANANLTGLTERHDAGTASGNGGGLAIWSGNLAAAGATGTLTATLAASSIEAYMVISYKGVNNYSAPALQATDLTLEGDRQVNHIKAVGSNNTLVVWKNGGAVDATPTDGVEYEVGDEIGTGNIVIGNGPGTISIMDEPLAFGSTVDHFRAFSWNQTGSGPQYNVTTATGNPANPTAPADIPYYLYHHPIASSTRYPTAKDVSRTASKAYTGSFCETSTEYLLFTVGDNLQGPTNEYHYDQTFLRYKSKADGLPFQEGWQWYDDVNGEPIAVLTSGFAESNGASIQNWLAFPTVFADDNIVAYYSYNVGNIGARYGVGKAVSTDGGRTWSRTVTNITAAGAGEDHYQFQHGYYNTTLSKWILLSPNARSGAEGRWTQMRVYESTDGITGLNFVKIANDIVLNTPIDVGGFGLQGPIWESGGVYNWYATEDGLPAYKTNPAVDLDQQAYPYLQRKVNHISTSDLSVAIPTLVIERVNYVSDQQAICSIFPASLPITHGGAEHIICSCFLWKPEDGTQISIDVRVLSTVAYTGNGAKTVGRNVYPGYMHRFYKMHQTHLSDVYQSTTTNPIELIEGDTMTHEGTGDNPTQFNMNSVVVNGKHPQGISFTHSQTYLGLKMVISATTAFDSVTRGIVEKAGTFRITLFEGNRLEVWLYGVGGGIKKYRSVEIINNLRNLLWAPQSSARIGFTAILNVGATDIDLKLHVDHNMDVALTTIQSATFTEIIQNSNPITFGHVSGVTDHNQFIGSCIIFSGEDYATQENWLEENCI